MEQPEDHTELLEPSSRTRLPDLLNTSMPEVSLRGLSRLATQQMVSGEKENHIPRYRLVGSPGGEKKPSVNEPPAETRASPPVMLPPVAIMSLTGVAGPKINIENTMWRPIRCSRCLRVDIFGKAISSCVEFAVVANRP